MKSIVVRKKNTRKEVDRQIKEAKKDLRIFVCTTSDEVKNNGYTHLVKDVDMKTHNLIIIK